MSFLVLGLATIVAMKLVWNLTGVWASDCWQSTASSNSKTRSNRLRCQAWRVSWLAWWIWCARGSQSASSYNVPPTWLQNEAAVTALKTVSILPSHTVDMHPRSTCWSWCKDDVSGSIPGQMALGWQAGWTSHLLLVVQHQDLQQRVSTSAAAHEVFISAC